MFCIFTTRAEKRHLVQEMLTKNVEHVKMKKGKTSGIGQKEIYSREGGCRNEDSRGSGSDRNI